MKKNIRNKTSSVIPSKRFAYQACTEESHGARSFDSLRSLRMTTLRMLLMIFTLTFLMSTVSFASPWTKNESYAGKAAGKFGFGLKNAAFFWLHPFKEAKQPGYDNEFQGFTNGIGQSVFFMVNGLVQLVTFPVPVDVMDLGDGVTAKPRKHRTIVGPEPPEVIPPSLEDAMDEEMAKIIAAHEATLKKVQQEQQEQAIIASQMPDFVQVRTQEDVKADEELWPAREDDIVPQTTTRKTEEEKEAAMKMAIEMFAGVQ